MYNCKINYILLNSKRKIKKKSINKVYFLIYDILLQRLRINVTRKPSRGVEDKLQIGTFVEQPLVWPQCSHLLVTMPLWTLLLGGLTRSSGPTDRTWHK